LARVRRLAALEEIIRRLTPDEEAEVARAVNILEPLL
jgi:hypothetical protein